jgi:hypothetical protein
MIEPLGYGLISAEADNSIFFSFETMEKEGEV